MSCISSNNWDKISVFCYVTINNFYSIVYLIKKDSSSSKAYTHSYMYEIFKERQ